MIMPGLRQGSCWNTSFEVTSMTRPKFEPLLPSPEEDPLTMLVVTMGQHVPPTGVGWGGGGLEGGKQATNTLFKSHVHYCFKTY